MKHRPSIGPPPIPRVLLVEDDDDTRLEITAALEDHGFAVDGVSRGHAGLLRALEGAFDAVVLDRMLPDVDGLSILSTLRNVGKQTPVLILSALSAVDERVRGLRAGGDDYLTKPFDSLELTARLNALLRRRPSSRRCRAWATSSSIQTRIVWYMPVRSLN